MSDFWEDLGHTVAKAAPMLGGAIGGPGGAAIGQLVASAFGVDADDPQAVKQAIEHDPEAAAKLREIELRHKERLEELALERKELAFKGVKEHLEDTQNARTRDIELRKLGDENKRANWMIIGDVVGLVACLVMLYFIKDMNGAGEIRGIISTIAGFFGLGLRDAHQFEFGSSRGSKTKDALLGSKG